MSAPAPPGDADTEPGEPYARVPPPVPPADPDAWYAPDVRAQYEVRPGVVATIAETEGGFRYHLREPPLSGADERALDRVRAHFADAHLTRPLTREGTVEFLSGERDAVLEATMEAVAERLSATREA